MTGKLTGLVHRLALRAELEREGVVAPRPNLVLSLLHWFQGHRRRRLVHFAVRSSSALALEFIGKGTMIGGLFGGVILAE